MAQGLTDAEIVRSGYGCNNACRFCNQGDWRHTRGDRGADEVRAEARAAGRRAAEGSGVLVLAGGEVTLRPELAEWIETAREAGARRVVVQTNGRMLAYRKLARRLVRAGADVFAFALHGHQAEVHDWLTRSPGSFEDLIHGVHHVRAAGATVLVNTVVTRPNFRHLPDIARMLPNLEARGVRFIWPSREGEAIEQAPGLIPDPTLVAPYLWRAVGTARALNRRVSLDLPHDFPESERFHVDVPARAAQ